MNVFIGHYIEVLTTFSSFRKINFVIVEDNKLNEEISSFCKKNNITIIEVKNSLDISNWIKKEKIKIDICLVASFGLILKYDFISCCEILINIHPGNFRDCRGRHPLPFAISKKLENMTITAHLIDSEKIDAGPVIAEFNTPIDYNLSYDINYKRLRLLLEPLVCYIFNQINNCGNLFSKKTDMSASNYNNKLSNEKLIEILSAKKLIHINYEGSN
jgi:methionyl-tRNA formyltransferase